MLYPLHSLFSGKWEESSFYFYFVIIIIIIIIIIITILYNEPTNAHNYSTNYHTATCFDTIVSSSDSL